jgi:hypothetical protein
MSIQKEFVLRYREAGHVRFQIPASVCNEAVAKQLTNSLLAVTGVYRVNLYRGQQKLSIRYRETVCDFPCLARQLFHILNELDLKPVAELKDSWQGKAKAKLNSLKVTRWTKQKYADAKETVHAAKIITKLGMKKPQAFVSNPEKAAIDFFNDILVLFLIKLHWPSITQQWLVKPLKYRYEWMALFYMFFLLVRSRRKK